MSNKNRLREIKIAHTLIWAVLAAGILALSWIAWHRLFELAACISLVVLAEGFVLALNHGRCPLTDMAAKYTGDRSANFDIYLPLWIARNNKAVFGSLFLFGETLLLVQFLRK